MITQWQISQMLGAALNHEFEKFKGVLNSKNHEKCVARAWVRVANLIQQQERKRLLPLKKLHPDAVGLISPGELFLFDNVELKSRTRFYVLETDIIRNK
jgi:hypothetical protein